MSWIDDKIFRYFRDERPPPAEPPRPFSSSSCDTCSICGKVDRDDPFPRSALSCLRRNCGVSQ